MPALQNIKIGRLMLAISVTVLIADTAPHPSLSTGLLESSWERLAINLMAQQDVTAARPNLTH
ncbi:hypothetical protein [Leptolyngbya iicbica]|uniref:Uncharacterized protein n=2 Tax=Cyanophyceae TaxID=3028117 RepID=A0A4Q7DZR4_9CYAN|nr:hypothetical protein [Leptolyngbya sp. LK]RZM75047.1 hypothetical protein DYY88_22310 [Leptolyngbya sp. LK]